MEEDFWLRPGQADDDPQPDGQRMNTFTHARQQAQLSFIASAWCFFARNLYASRLALYQEILRLVGFRYSVSLFPLVLSFTGVMNVWLNGFLFILSEFLKIYSLWIYKYEGERPPVKE